MGQNVNKLTGITAGMIQSEESLQFGQDPCQAQCTVGDAGGPVQAGPNHSVKWVTVGKKWSDCEH